MKLIGREKSWAKKKWIRKVTSDKRIDHNKSLGQAKIVGHIKMAIHSTLQNGAITWLSGKENMILRQLAAPQRHSFFTVISFCTVGAEASPSVFSVSRNCDELFLSSCLNCIQRAKQNSD